MFLMFLMLEVVNLILLKYKDMQADIKKEKIMQIMYIFILTLNFSIITATNNPYKAINPLDKIAKIFE